MRTRRRIQVADKICHVTARGNLRAPIFLIDEDRTQLPCRAGICSRAEDWPWSSHRATAGMLPRPSFLTVDRVRGWFGSSAEEAVDRYRAFVDAGVDEPLGRPPLEQVLECVGLENIALAHLRYGYTLREIALLVGLSPATLCRKLRARRLTPP